VTYTLFVTQFPTECCQGAHHTCSSQPPPSGRYKEQETSKDEQLMVIMEHKEGDMPTRSAQ
jgi:hypothetical protein